MMGLETPIAVIDSRLPLVASRAGLTYFGPDDEHGRIEMMWKVDGRGPR